ncbi:MAG: excinuclease ABC subunit UvrA, partial [Candidatus Methylomirabilis sp.]|nr:excinuclease ABC subunit UvrA [Deltaproteobacteria bacterium]
MDKIVITGAREHNLKNLDLEIPRDKLVVLTGLSGSGKSSLAFDTIYAEGQRRYVESLSAYARQFLEQMEKPDVESIEGLSPAIAIEQKTTSRNPRSTIGTVTEIYDYLRLLYARAGRPHCYECGDEIRSQTVDQIVGQILALPLGTKITVMAPLIRGRKGEYRKELEQLRKEGYVRVRVDGEEMRLEDKIVLDKKRKHDIDVVVDRIVLKDNIRKRLADSVETATGLAQGIVKIEWSAEGEAKERMFSQRFACIRCGISYPELAPQMFSFNSPHGACPDCDGLGNKMYFDPDLVVPDPDLSLEEGALAPWTKRHSSFYAAMLASLAAHYKFKMDTPWRKLSPKVRQALLEGSGETPIKFKLEGGDSSYSFKKPFDGVLANLERRYKESSSDSVREDLENYMSMRPCPACKGARLRKEALHVRVGGKTIREVTALNIGAALAWFSDVPLSETEHRIADLLLREINERLGFLVKVGLDYLTLDRGAATLSGGEGQRIRLATQIGSSLV